MTRFGRVCISTVAMALAFGAHAAVQSVDAGNVGFSYDTSNFILVRYSDGFSGAVEETIVPFEDLSLVALENGLSLNFNNQMSLNDATHGIGDNNSSENGAYRVLFDFTPEPGYAITGYTVTMRGSYSITTPANARLYLDGFGEAYVDHGFGVIEQTFQYSGSTAPMLQGDLAAFSETIVFEQYVGDVYIQTGVNYYPDPSCEGEPDCPLLEEPIFEYVPHYELAYNGGDASISLNELRLVANVAAVPVPAAWGFLLAGVAVLRHAPRRA